MKWKVREAKEERDNFLVYVRNPIKICLLLFEFIQSKLQLTDSSSSLRYEGKVLIEELLRIAN